MCLYDWHAAEQKSKSMSLIIKTKLLICLFKANLHEKVLFVKITRDPKIRKTSVRCLYENQEFHFPFWSIIYLTLKSKFNAMVCFRN